MTGRKNCTLQVPLCGGLMVSALDSRASSPGSSPGRGHWVVFLGKTLNSQCLSPPTCINGYQQIVGGNLTNCAEVTCDGLASRPGEVEILLAASCYKLRQWWASLGFKASLFTSTSRYPIERFLRLCMGQWEYFQCMIFPSCHEVSQTSHIQPCSKGYNRISLASSMSAQVLATGIL